MTLAIYSGVPNPLWTVHSHHKNFEKTKSHLHSARTAGTSYHLEHMPSIVGYKGLLVHPPEAKEAELVVGQETKELQKLLLETAPEGLLSDALRQKILQAIESTSVPLQTKSAPRQEVLQAPITGDKFDGKIKHYAPKLNLGRWNSYSPI